MPPIRRTRAGDFRLSLSEGERQLLRSLPGELAFLLENDPDDPSLRRLFPPAYEDDAEGEAEYERLMQEELRAGRRQALGVLEATADRDRLSEDELEAWLGALNDLRLVLGTRLGVTEDLYEQELDPRHSQAHEHAVYAYLTWLQGHVVEAVDEA